MALTERIRTIVGRLKWQDQELATKLGLSKATLSQRFAKSSNPMMGNKIFVDVVGAVDFKELYPTHPPHPSVD